MMTEYDSGGFEELPHSADWALRVWGSDFAALTEAAIRGMQALMGLTFQDGPRVERSLTVHGADREEILVSCLAEVLYCLQSEGLGIETCEVETQPEGMVLKVGLRSAIAGHKEIKAVTYHGLSVQTTEKGMETRLVFDV